MSEENKTEKNVVLDHMLQQNALLTRAGLLNQLIDPQRNIDKECGYPLDISIEDYKLLYDREGIAARVVSVYPEECWKYDPSIVETEEAVETDFEAAWNELVDKFNVWHYLQRIDELSGVGHFGVLLLGVDDGKQLHEPIEGIADDSTRQSDHDRSLLYLRPFPESYVQVESYEGDPTNPRFGKPKFYNLKFQDHTANPSSVQASPEDTTTKKVHWHRVIHVADNRKSSEVFGTPRMKPVFNRLYDLRKVLSGSGEMFWKGAFPGYTFEVNPEYLEQGGEVDTKSMREEFEKYSNSLQRYMALTGVSAKSLAPQVSDPGPHMMAHLKSICISLSIPWRIFLGSEEAKLASNQDTKAWNGRLANRQTKYVGPLIIREFVDRLVALSIMPEPSEDGYKVTFQDLNAATDAERADVAVKQTDALSKYIAGGVDTLIPPKEYFMHILNLSQEEADGLIDAAQRYLESVDDDQEDDEKKPLPGNEPAPAEPQEDEDDEAEEE